MEAIEEDTTITLTVFGEIGEGTTSTIIPELLNADFNVIKEIDLYICSEGGFLPHCFAIIDFILNLKKNYDIKINTYGLGEVVSGGFFLFILGDKRFLFPNCKIFVHEHIITNEDFQTYSDRLKSYRTIEKQLYQSYLNYTANQLDLTKRKTKILLAKNAWLNNKDIKTYNILGIKNEQ